MTVPKLTWGEFKDADGNWLPRLTPRDVIEQLTAERDALAARLAVLETAGDALSRAAIVVRGATDSCPDCLMVMDGREDHADNCVWLAFEEALAAWTSAWEEAGE